MSRDPEAYLEKKWNVNFSTSFIDIDTYKLLFQFLYSLFLLLSTFCSVGEDAKRLQELRIKRQKKREARSKEAAVHVATEKALQVCLSLSTSPLLSSGS